MGLQVPQQIVDAYKGWLEFERNGFRARAGMLLIAFYVAWIVAGVLFFVVDNQ